MNFSTKIDLENRIFYRAACLGACVLSCGGEVLCTAPDVYLQTLISVYNAFFAEGNRYLLEDEALAWHDWWQAYKRQVVEGACPIFTPDLRIELAWCEGLRESR